MLSHSYWLIPRGWKYKLEWSLCQNLRIRIKASAKSYSSQTEHQDSTSIGAHPGLRFVNLTGLVDYTRIKSLIFGVRKIHKAVKNHLYCVDYALHSFSLDLAKRAQPITFKCVMYFLILSVSSWYHWTNNKE